MKWGNRDNNVAEWAKIPMVPPLLAKWRLGENVVLELMKCLSPAVSFDIFMDNYFTSFHQLTLLRVNNIRATRVLNRNMLRKSTIIRDSRLRKKERCYFKQRRSSKKAV